MRKEKTLSEQLGAFRWSPKMITKPWRAPLSFTMRSMRASRTNRCVDAFGHRLRRGLDKQLLRKD